MDLKPKAAAGRGKAEEAGRKSIKRLEAALERAGRSDELADAERDLGKLDALMREFEVEGGGGGAF